MKTLARTLFVWKKGQPVAFRVTEIAEHLFRSNGSGLVKDLGGDPGAWLVATSDYVMSVASNDLTGFRLVKGTCSASKLEQAVHAWKTITTLEEFTKLDHPLNEGAGTIEQIREAYEARRSQVDAA